MSPSPGHDWIDSDDDAVILPMSRSVGPLLLEAVPLYLATRQQRGELAPTTIAVTRRILRSFAWEVGDHRHVGQVTPRMVRRWWDAQECGRSTARNRLSVVRTFLDWTVERGWLHRNPTTGIRPPREPRRVPRVLSPDDVARLLAAAPDERGRAVVALMVQCGLRCVEVHRLRMEHIDFRQRVMLVRGKGGHERYLPLPDEALRYLNAYLDRWPAPTTGPVIRRYDDENLPLSAHTLGTWVGRWMKAAGIKRRPLDGVSAHALRRTCASDMLDAGAHPRHVQAVLGHAHLQTTEVYLRRLEAGDLRAAMEGRVYSADVLDGAA